MGKNHYNSNTILYHCAPESQLANILKEGLCPSYSKSSLKAIFITDDFFTAQNYSNMKNEKCIVLQFCLGDLDINLCGPDNYELQQWIENNRSEFKNWQEADAFYSLEKVNQFAYYGKINPSALQIIKF